MKNVYSRTFLHLVMLVLLPLMSQAAFVPIDGHIYKIVNRATGLAQEIGGNNRYDLKHAVNEWDYFGRANQQWTFERSDLYSGSASASEYLIRNFQSGRFMTLSFLTGETATSEYNETDVPYGTRSLFDGTFINQYYYEPGNYQDWHFEEIPGTLSPMSGQPYYHIVNTYSNKVLENISGDAKRAAEANNRGYIETIYDYEANPSVSGHWTWQRTADINNQYQHYDIVDVTPNPNNLPELGVFQIIHKKTGRAMTATGDNTGVVLRASTNSKEQQWTFVSSGSSFPPKYYIQNKVSAQVVEIGGAATAPNSTINMWPNFGHAHQQWTLYEAHDASNSNPITSLATVDPNTVYKISSGYASKVIELRGDISPSLYDVSPLSLWYDYAWDDANNQKQQWYIRLVSYNRTASDPNTASSPSLMPVKPATHAETSKREVKETAKSLKNDKLLIYPNPARELLSVSLGSNNPITIVSVTDSRGATATARYIGNGQVDVRSLPPGLYILTVSDGLRTFRQKFAKN